MKRYETSDIAIAAYLQLVGKVLLLCERTESGRFQFVFDDSEGDCHGRAIEYLSSPFSRFDNLVRNLKKILFK